MKRIKQFTSRQWPFARLHHALVVLCSILMISTVSANEIDLDKPIELEPGKGVAIFSASVTNPPLGGIRLMQLAYLSWRSAGNSENSESIRIDMSGRGFFSKFDEERAKQGLSGRFAALQLPEGVYEWHDVSAQSRDTHYSSEKPFSRKFRVKAGQISYVGSMDILPATDALREGGRYAFAALAFLIPFSKADFKPWLSDQSAVDLPLLYKKGAKLTPSNLVLDVMPDEVDVTTEKRIVEITRLADQGDLGAKRSLANLYWYKFFVEDNGVILRANRNIPKAETLFAHLAETGDGEAAYQLATAYDAKYAILREFNFADNPGKALHYYQLAAEHYYVPAIARLAKVLANGELGATESSQQARLWSNRADRLQEVPAVPPYLDAAGLAAYKTYEEEPANPKHFAIAPSGAYGWAGYASGEDEQPYRTAIKQCETRNTDKQHRCSGYLVGSRVRWNACASPFVVKGNITTFAPADLPELDGKAAEQLPPDPALRKAFQDFLTQPMPRAMAISPSRGIWVIQAGDCRAPAAALQQCSQKNGGSPCELFAQDDRLTAKSEYGQKLAVKYSGPQEKMAKAYAIETKQ